MVNPIGQADQIKVICAPSTFIIDFIIFSFLLQYSLVQKDIVSLNQILSVSHLTQNSFQIQSNIRYSRYIQTSTVSILLGHTLLFCNEVAFKRRLFINEFLTSWPLATASLMALAT